MSECLFCRIVAGEIPAKIVHEDDKIMAFRDVNPEAPVHILVIPKEHIPGANDLSTEHGALLGSIFDCIRRLAEAEGVAKDGYRVVTNCNRWAGQSVFHLHFHLIGGRALSWPPG